ncbi:IS701 family transposase [Streptacidiphilus sp. N1-3]|uniref:IS701 family transposase n=1 Tax=Streptacidiphilus alkalitolerans TaxID=3342712 RepID=A0ABV6WTP0_9ACTN
MTTTFASLETTVPQQAAVLCDRVFPSLSRRDQRGKAEQYLHGLLSAPGRKSMRNIAGHLGSTAAEQSLHHFISASTWDYAQVRAALADYVEEEVRPQAWVLRPMVIPKAGQHSVGVERRFVPEFGQAVNCQQAYGVWAASDAVSCPIDWQLHLPDRWMADPELRRRAKIPADARWLSPVECAIDAAAATASRDAARPHPVVLDLADTELGVGTRLLDESGLTFAAGIGATTRLIAADLAVPRHGTEFTAAHLLQLARTRWRPVEWQDPSGGGSRTSMVAAVRVRLAGRPGTPLLLLGEWTDLRAGSQRFWLSNWHEATWGQLLRTAKLAQRVELDFAEVSGRVGLMDFEGRCYEGWHRHATLASVAHAVAVLAARRSGAGYDRRGRAA